MNSYKIQEFIKYTSYKIHKLQNTRVKEYTSYKIHQLQNTQVKEYTSYKIHEIMTQL